MLYTCAFCGHGWELPKRIDHWPQATPGVEIYPVTDDGKPDGDLRGYICARCLGMATSMRVYMLMASFVITEHALQRFISRNPRAHLDEATARVAMRKMLGQARRVRFKREFMTKRFVSNDCQEVHYLYSPNGFIFVTTIERPPVVVTVERTGGKKLNRDFFYVKGKD